MCCPSAEFSEMTLVFCAASGTMVLINELLPPQTDQQKQPFHCRFVKREKVRINHHEHDKSGFHNPELHIH